MFQRAIHHEGELVVSLDDNNPEKPTKQYAILNGTCLKFYICKEEWTNPSKVIDLTEFHSISNSKKTKYFHLEPKSNSKSVRIKLKAVTRKDKLEWIKTLRKILDDSYGTTVKIDNQVESICSIWFLLSCIVMVILFVVPIAITKPDELHYFAIVLSQYEMALVVLCFYYFCQFKWNKIRQVMRLNKFWIEKALCFLYNFIAFLLLTINISIHTDHVHLWNFTYAATFLFGSFSIPFPAVCVKLHHELKYNENNGHNNSPVPSPTLSSMQLVPSHNQQQETVKSFLENIVKLPQYYETFQRENINTMRTVRELTNEDLREMKIAIGHRKRILNYIQNDNYKQISVMSNMSKRTTVSVLFASKAIFRDNISKGAICLCYMVHFFAYIGFPLLYNNKYDELNSIIYYNYDKGNTFSLIMYNINQIFLRTFVGMCLSSVFFSLVTELIDKQITSTNYRILLKIWSDELNKYWIMVVVVILTMIPLELIGQLPDWKHQQVLGSQGCKMIFLTVNGVWIIINSIATLINVKFIMLFSGIYRKTKHEYIKFYQASSSPVSPIKAFVMEAATLLSLYLIYIVFMVLYYIKIRSGQSEQNAQQIIGDIFRQTIILFLSILQFFTLIRVKQIQKFGGIYLPRFSKRSKFVFHGYYKFNCILLMYNVVYIFIFKLLYFGSYFGHRLDDTSHKYQNFAYAFAFSVSASMLFLLSHFVASYQKWKTDREAQKLDINDVDHYVLMADMSEKREKNDHLNKFMADESKRQDELLHQVSTSTATTACHNAESNSITDSAKWNGSRSVPTKQNKLLVENSNCD